MWHQYDKAFTTELLSSPSELNSRHVSQTDAQFWELNSRVMISNHEDDP
jgi:hypothetical protein